MSEQNHKNFSIRSWLSGPFLLAALLLILAATLLPPVLKVLASHYEKEPIAIRRSLKTFDPQSLLFFQKDWDFHDSPVSAEEIGTEEYTYITFQRKDKLKSPQQIVLFITYYSDPRDKVPHTPEVCSRQAGAIVRRLTTTTIDIPESGQAVSPIEAKLLILDQQKQSSLTLYVFCVEGLFRHDREQVRWIIGKPGNRHVFFSKIEVAALLPANGDTQAAFEACKEVLSQMIPVLVNDYFPTKEQIQNR